jgi:hypothetical protein
MIMANLAEQMQAQIALNKALPLIQMQLSNNSFALVDYRMDCRSCLFKTDLIKNCKELI